MYVCLYIYCGYPLFKSNWKFDQEQLEFHRGQCRLSQRNLDLTKETLDPTESGNESLALGQLWMDILDSSIMHSLLP